MSMPQFAEVEMRCLPTLNWDPVSGFEPLADAL